jgi:MATE family multidrug resistance protein
VVAQSTTFYLVIMVSMTPAILSMALKNHADAMDRPWPPFWIFLGGVILNVFLNWVLIYGNLGSPQYGLEGAAWATFISRWAIVGGMFWWFAKSRVLREWIPNRWFRKPDWRAIGRFWAIGFPASLQMVCEVAAFSAAGLLMGQFGEEAMAAHQIALMCAATAFMVPLGLAMALSVRIGEAAGRLQVSRLRAITVSGWMLGAGWALVSAVFFFAAGDWLAALFNENSRVVAVAANILVVVGVFQLVDSLQVGSVSILRGLHDTRVPAFIAFLAYWVIGIPVAVALAQFTGLGAVGVWIGLAVGLLVACLLLCRRAWQRTAPVH